MTTDKKKDPPEQTKVSRMRTKAQLLKGRDSTEEVFIPLLDAEVELRPLTDGQATELDAMPMQGQTFDPTAITQLIDTETGQLDRSKLMAAIHLDAGLLVEMQARCDRQAVAWSIVVTGGPLELSEVAGMRPPGVVEQIAAEVYRISGIGKEGAEKARDFRENGSRDGAGAPAPEGDTASPVAG